VELYQPYAEPEIVKWIRSARLRWAGHIVRMRESDPVRKSTFDVLLGERTVGRPKRRWIEEVERELKAMVVKDWKRLALERDKWKKNCGGGQDLNWAVVPRRESFFGHHK
jgi:hypothetical protein